MNAFTRNALARAPIKRASQILDAQAVPIPRPKLPLIGLMALVAIAALSVFAMMPVRTGITDIRQGTGRAISKGDVVTVHYVGRLGGTRLSDWLNAGNEFDSSRCRNAPFTVKIGAGQLIRGWDEGMIGLKEGGLRKLVIPSEMAYGSMGVPPTVPPNATLIFEVELLKIEK